MADYLYNIPSKTIVSTKTSCSKLECKEVGCSFPCCSVFAITFPTTVDLHIELTAIKDRGKTVEEVDMDLSITTTF